MKTILTEELVTKLRKYEGKWVALFGPDEAMEVVAVGDDAGEASQRAERAGFHDAILQSSPVRRRLHTSRIKYTYGRQPDARDPDLPWTRRPAIPVQLSFHGRRKMIFALVDSGADTTVFHISIAKALGIGTFQRQGWAVGISGERMSVYYQDVRLQTRGAPDSIEIEAAFIDSPGVGALLGQTGFFEHYRICFDRSRDEIEIHPTPGPEK